MVKSLDKKWKEFLFSFSGFGPNFLMVLMGAYFTDAINPSALANAGEFQRFASGACFILPAVFPLLYAIAKAFDGIIDIPFAHITDTLSTKWGRRRPTIMVIVPALAEMALNLSRQFGRNMLGPDLKTIICGAATVAPYLVHEYDKLGIALLPGYGLTESANLVSGNPEALKKSASVGFIYDGMEYKIVDGELWLKGVNMMEGYVGEPEENANAYEDGWFKTGDLVRIDEEGFLYIVGRKKEIIVLPSGENVSPAEIEAKFGEIDAVQDCLVYENKETGRSGLVLEVYPRKAVLAAMQIADTEKYLREEINKVNESLPSEQRINKIVIRETDFVRSPSMKIVREQNAK